MSNNVFLYLALCFVLGCFNQAVNGEERSTEASCGETLPPTGEAGRGILPVNLAIRHSLYHQYTGDAVKAYVIARYHELRGLAAVEVSQLRLTRAAITLDMGLLDHGLCLTQGLSLTSDQQSELQLFLARTAYRRSDWKVLQAAITELQGIQLESQYLPYLRAEASRVDGDLQAAYRHLQSLDTDDALYFFASYNLAGTALRAEDNDLARLVLQELFMQQPGTTENALIVERARLLLAEQEYRLGKPDEAVSHLQQVRANGRYGPDAMARLAAITLEQGNTALADRLWRLLLSQAPAHPLSRQGYRALALLVEKGEGRNAALPVYLQAESQLAHQAAGIAAVTADFAARPAAEIGQELMSIAEPGPLLRLFHDQLGPGAWASWLGSEQAQQRMQQWQRLQSLQQQLLAGQDQLQHLGLLDLERERRINQLNMRLGDNSVTQQLDSAVAQLQQQRWLLQGVVQRTGEWPLALANSEEQSLLDYLTELQERALLLNASDVTHRLTRLKGRIYYGLQVNAPIRAQNLSNRLAVQERRLQGAQASTERISRAYGELSQTLGISNRLVQLSERLSLMERDTRHALDGASARLLASLRRRLEFEAETVAVELVAVRYDIARIHDDRLFAEAEL